MPTIRIDPEVYQFIKDFAEPLSTTPNEALKEMFGLTAEHPHRFSFQARLEAVGKALASNDHAELALQLHSIRLAYKAGVFRG